MRFLLMSLALSLVLSPVLPVIASEPAGSDSIQWQTWSSDVFARAKAEHKYVILDLEAVWCHWCHVQDEQTYSNPAVIHEIGSHYIAVKVDQDSRPDLANRYIDYAWPATVIYGPNGQEIVKRAGFIQPDLMVKLLEAVVSDPSPEKYQDEQAAESTGTTYLTEAQRRELEQAFADEFDTEHGTWGAGGHKFLDADSAEYTINQAQAGDKQAAARARQSLDANLALLDPIWGGVYQYSHGGTWDHPHFEKIMSVQTANMRIYALAYSVWHDPGYLNLVNRVHGYMQSFLMSPEGAFYTSQDADVVEGQHSGEYFQLDDAHRRQLGTPRVDQHIYARENGWAIEALAYAYGVTGDQTELQEAIRAARWIEQNRSLPNGGFRHDAVDKAGPYLADSLAMGRAYLELYRVTADRAWLTKAEQAAGFIQTEFQDKGNPVGYVSAKPIDGLSVGSPVPNRDENVALARFTNLLYRYTGQPQYQAMTEQAMQYLTIPQIARRPFTATTLLANQEVTSEPLHITVVGPKSDQKAQALYQAALQYPDAYSRIEWLDKSEGDLPNLNVAFPPLDKPAAFVCTNNRCSLPIFEDSTLQQRIDRLRGGHPATPISAQSEGV